MEVPWCHIHIYICVCVCLQTWNVLDVWIRFAFSDFSIQGIWWSLELISVCIYLRQTRKWMNGCVSLNISYKIYTSIISICKYMYLWHMLSQSLSWSALFFQRSLRPFHCSDLLETCTCQLQAQIHHFLQQMGDFRPAKWPKSVPSTNSLSTKLPNQGEKKAKVYRLSQQRFYLFPVRFGDENIKRWHFHTMCIKEASCWWW